MSCSWLIGGGSLPIRSRYLSHPHLSSPEDNQTRQRAHNWTTHLIEKALVLTRCHHLSRKPGEQELRWTKRSLGSHRPNTWRGLPFQCLFHCQGIQRAAILISFEICDRVYYRVVEVIEDELLAEAEILGRATCRADFVYHTTRHSSIIYLGNLTLIYGVLVL